jgi:hypothetical protein
MAILASVVAENVVEKMKRSARDAELGNLGNFATAFTKCIQRDKTILTPTNWAVTISDELSLPLSKVRKTTSGAYRLFITDPAFTVGTNLSTPLPYTQTVRGSPQPANTRVLMVSSLAGSLPSLTIDATAFNSIWGVGPDQIPTGWPSAWGTYGKEVKVQRVDLGYLFHRVVLNNLDVLRNAPYSIDSTNTLTYVPAGTRLEAWYIDGTAINFHFNDGSLQAREFIHEDVSYVYENGRWSRYLNYGRNNLMGLFGQMVDAFLASPPNPDTKFAASQQSIVDEMYNYLWYFGLWAEEGFPVDGTKPLPQVPEFRVVVDAQDRLSDFSDNLVN